MTRPQAAKVAKVGRRMHAAQPLRGSLFRIYLRHIAKWMLIVLGLLLVLALVLAVLTVPQGQRRIDCTTAAWHPDVPPAGKAQCRNKAPSTFSTLNVTSRK